MSAFLNQQRPEARNDFWSKPEVEIDIAASAGVQARAPRGKRAALRCGHGFQGARPAACAAVCGKIHLLSRLGANPETALFLGTQLFRLGVDWGRIIPALPSQAGGSVPDAAALARYREIIKACASSLESCSCAHCPQRRRWLSRAA